MQLKVEVDEDVFNKLVVRELTDAYITHINFPVNKEHDKRMLKALKRVIEYYGGSVDNG